MGAPRSERVTMRRLNRSAVTVVMAALVLGACSADLSLNNVTLTPKPETLARKQEWATPNLDRPITSVDLIGADGQCSGPPPASADATPAVAGGIALQMTECDVVRRAGPVETIESGVNARGERSVVLTYVRGPWPGIYRFAGGPLGPHREAPPPAAPAREAAKGQQKARRQLIGGQPWPLSARFPSSSRVRSPALRPERSMP